ncbi:hypothetical protein SAMN05660691_01626 [Rheinheimera pacifica]|uniref:Uncharacterized protein n=1 Tax=Rheinheimera pacifica TaxID=173990 RepID=A0A1H6LA16_9GAMM|nr:hypothetical protein [Rheinheimera pacifica]SEH81326.1 hypothetical protein SAMN05660691_01626 [Rheinheimera pacifica]
MSITIAKIFYLFLACSSFFVYSQNNLPWTKYEILATLPKPYGKTTIVFSTTVQDNQRVISEVAMTTATGSWQFLSEELRQLPLKSLTDQNAIMLKKDCPEFQQDCISMVWQMDEPRSITFVDGFAQEYFKLVKLNISGRGNFKLTVDDTYQDGVKLEQQYREFMREYKEPSARDSKSEYNENVVFNFPAMSLSKPYYGSQIFYYESEAFLGKLSIENTIVDALPVAYRLSMPSGDLVVIDSTIKEKNLRFSGFSYPLVTVNEAINKLTITIPCLIEHNLSADVVHLTVNSHLRKGQTATMGFSRHEAGDKLCRETH